MPYNLCDDNNDGFTCFDLPSRDAEITGGAPNLVVTYHETLTDAENGVNAIVTNPYCNIVSGVQVLHIRVTDASAPLCASLTTMELHVNPVPVPADPIADFELCDVDTPGDGFQGFDLPQMDAQILDGQTGVVVTYYLTPGDAQAGVNAIDTSVPFVNTTNPQQICARLEIPGTGCFATACFNLVVNPLPGFTAPGPMNACSEDTPDTATFILTVNDMTISQGVPGVTVSYHLSQLGAETETQVLASPYTNISNPQTVYVRVEDAATGCFVTTTLVLNVTQGPVANLPEALQVCDPNSDGFAAFDLTAAYDDIAGGPVPAGVSITFHETPEDAQNDVNPWASPYENIVAYNQTLYVRVEYELTGCANFTTLALIVNNTPQATELADGLQLCDDNDDGLATFDLTLATAGILGNLDPALHQVSYYVLEANAISGTNPIAGVLAFSNSTPDMQIIWVRVEHTATGCFDVIPLELIVNPLPLIPNPVPSLTLCDVTAPGDEIEQFDLTLAYPSILNGQTGMLVTFHLTAADALSGAGALPTLYSNGPNAQTLHVRLENEDTGCFVTSTMDIRVEPLPSPVPLTEPLSVCDADGDGFAEFNLEELIIDILQGAPDTVITFHETEQDAIDGNNAIANTAAYTNIDPFTQQLWIRAVNTLTGCVNWIPMELIVVPSPVVPDLDPLIECDQDSDPQDGQTFFDLTVQTPIILDAQTGTLDYTVEYYETQPEAEAGTGPIIGADNYFSDGTNPQVIWVRVSDPDGECFGIGSFELQINTPLPLTAPSQLTVCDDGPTDPVPTTLFDLTVKDAEITGGDSTYTVQYFEQEADMLAGTNPIPNPSAYTNIENAQTLFVAVTGPAPALCRSFTTLTIRVLPLPSPQTQDIPVIEACDVTAPDGTEPFDLTQNEEYIREDDPDIAFMYFPTLEDAEELTNQILDPTAYESASGSVFIRVVRDTEPNYLGEFCFVIVEQELLVQPLPVISPDPMPYQVCDGNNDGQEVIDLTAQGNPLLTELVLGTTQSPADYTLTFYPTLADAQTGTGSLGSSYNVTSSPQDIYVTITHTTSGCISVPGVVTLTVAAGATAEDAELFACDDAGVDGITAVDLTSLDTTVLNGQDATLFTVAYYPTLLAAQTQTGAITPANNYLATTGTIYAVVTNTATGCGSIPVEVVISIEPLIAPVIDATTNGNTICVDANTDLLISGLTLVIEDFPTIADYTYQWFIDGVDTGVTGTTYVIDEIDEYGAFTVVATSLSEGCVSEPSAAFTVVRSGPAVAQGAGYTVSDAFSDSQTVTITVEGYGNGFYHFQLDDGPILDNGGVFTNVSPGEHYVTVYDMAGTGTEHCDPTLIEGIFTISYPVFFTPNGDGINDTWNIIWPDGDDTPKIYIFDRYGKLLKQIAPNSLGWDGTYNGQNLPSTDYWFTVEYPETGAIKEFKAHFSLKR